MADSLDEGYVSDYDAFSISCKRCDSFLAKSELARPMRQQDKFILVPMKDIYDVIFCYLLDLNCILINFFFVFSRHQSFLKISTTTQI